jgi:hypothetical protein
MRHVAILQKLDKEGFLIKTTNKTFFVEENDNRLEWSVNYDDVTYITVTCKNYVPLKFSSVATALRFFYKLVRDGNKNESV